MNWADLEGVWPPSEKSRPALLGLCVIQLLAIYWLFGRKKETKHAQKARATNLERLKFGMSLLIKDVATKDKEDKKGEDRDQDLPEASRVLGYIWDDVEDVSITHFGLEPTDETWIAVKKLFDRCVRAQLKKVIMFTEQARKMKQASAQHASSELQANQKWLEDHDTSEKELAEYLSGDKLEEELNMVKEVSKKMGTSIFSAETMGLVSEGKALKKSFTRPRGAAMNIIMSLTLASGPNWLLSIMMSVLSSILNAEFDKYLFTGKVVTETIREDGTWDRVAAMIMIKDLVAVCALWWISDLSAELFLGQAKARFTVTLKSRFMECLMFQDFEYFERHGAGVLQNRLTSDVEMVTENILSLPKRFVDIVLAMMTKIYMVSGIAPISVILLGLAPIPLIAWGNNKLLTYSSKQEEKGRRIMEQSVASTMDVISNIKTVRGFAMESKETLRFQRSAELGIALQQETSLVSGGAFKVFLFLLTANFGFSAYACGAKVEAGQMQMKDVSFFTCQLGFHLTFLFMDLFRLIPDLRKMMLPLNRVIDHMSVESKIEPNPNVAGMGPMKVQITSDKDLRDALEKLETQKAVSNDERFATFIQAKASFTAHDGSIVKPGARLVSYLSAEGDDEDALNVKDLQPEGKKRLQLPITLVFSRQLMPSQFRGEIEFQNVHFHYPLDLRKKVLDGLSFKIERGQKNGLCGEAGCGKSTTFLLLQRLFDAELTGGPVLIDGVDMRKYNIHFLRQRICMVAQQTILFKTSVRENIMYGMRMPPSDEEIKDALKKAQAWGFIEAKPDQLLTMLTETGGGFSGGQMQRLAIARVLIRKPDVILLDEATAALDPVNERAVQDTLDSVMKGYTQIVIAHRLTTIKDSKKIIVLDQGKVVEEGSHDDLLSIPIEKDLDDSGHQTIKAGFYHHQWQTQFAEKGLTTAKLQTKIAQLEMEIDVHRKHIENTNHSMSRWRAAGRVAKLLAKSSKSFADDRPIEVEEREENPPPAQKELSRTRSPVVELARVLSGSR